VTSEELHVLIVEDNPADVDWMRAALPETGPTRFHSESVARLSEALGRLAAGGIGVVMTDLGLPDSQGLATFRNLRQAAPDVAMIVLTGSGDLDMAVAAVREGAQDYLVKGQFSGDLLVRAVRYAIERKQMEDALKDSARRLRELSIVDELTQLHNSRQFYAQLELEMDRSDRYEQPLTLLLCDLDNFKAFNDTYGHVEGDQVLRRLGQVVKRCLRAVDFAYRYGGEEFTILLPTTTCAAGAVVAERIRAELKRETFSPTPVQQVHVTVSIGLGQYSPPEDMKAFVHRVDRLMYRGKMDGKDRVSRGP
jgi:two-component system, cell cycle response regulator